MTEEALSQPADSGVAALPESLVSIDLEGRRIHLLGTAHVSKESVVEVRQTIEQLRPDTVCVELDEARYQNLVDLGRWKNTNISELIRKGKAMLLLSSLIMSSFQRRIGKKLGVMPGSELLEATKVADEVGAKLVLIDRDIQITLKRTWARFGFWEKMKIATQLATSVLVAEEVDEQTIENLKQKETLGDALQMLASEFPSMKGALIDERDIYMAEKLRNVPGNNVVAVVGAGHVPGMMVAIQHQNEIGPLEKLPDPPAWAPWVKWSIPALIIGLFVYALYTGGTGKSIESMAIWALVTGSLAALGAIAALAHPLAVLSAFLAAPIATLHPLIAAGWVSGLVQAMVKKPTVADLEDLPEDINSARGFWRNPVSRILLVVAFSNLGSMAGTFVAGSWIAVRLFGS